MDGENTLFWFERLNDFKQVDVLEQSEVHPYDNVPKSGKDAKAKNRKLEFNKELLFCAAQHVRRKVTKNLLMNAAQSLVRKDEPEIDLKVNNLKDKLDQLEKKIMNQQEEQFRQLKENILALTK